MKLEFSQQIFEKFSNIKFHENPPIRSRVVPRGRTDMTKLIFVLRNFANSPENIESKSGGLNWLNYVLFMHKIRHCYKVKIFYQIWEVSIFRVYKFSCCLYTYISNEVRERVLGMAGVRAAGIAGKHCLGKRDRRVYGTVPETSEQWVSCLSTYARIQ